MQQSVQSTDRLLYIHTHPGQCSICNIKINNMHLFNLFFCTIKPNIISGGRSVVMLYNIIWGRMGDIFLLYNMWTVDDPILRAAVRSAK